MGGKIILLKAASSAVHKAYTLLFRVLYADAAASADGCCVIMIPTCSSNGYCIIFGEGTPVGDPTANGSAHGTS